MTTLESFIVDCFAKVPCNNLPADDFSKHSGLIFDSPEFNKIYYLEPVKEIIQVIEFDLKEEQINTINTKVV